MSAGYIGATLFGAKPNFRILSVISSRVAHPDLVHAPPPGQLKYQSVQLVERARKPKADTRSSHSPPGYR